MVIHQVHIYNFLHEQKDFTEPGSLSSRLLQEIMDNYATSYRSFKHGALHGTIAGIFFALPLLPFLLYLNKEEPSTSLFIQVTGS